MIRAYASAGGLVVEAGRVLVLERPGRRELRLPKGHIEPGETPRQAALRDARNAVFQQGAPPDEHARSNEDADSHA